MSNDVRQKFCGIFLDTVKAVEYVIGLEYNLTADSKSLVHVQSFLQLDKNMRFVKLRDHIVTQCKGKLFVSSLHISGVKNKAAIIKYCSKEDYNCVFTCKVSDLNPLCGKYNYLVTDVSCQFSCSVGLNFSS